MPADMVATDLQMLLWSVALCLIQMLVAVMLYQPQVGLPALAGNREGLKPPAGMADRAARAHRNMVENLVLFAALVLMAAITGRANEWTALGSIVFFWARVAYAVIFVAGIPWLRTAAWLVSIVGLLLVFSQLL
jgi:uncharacterized MAPEG superfamily protein